MLTHVFKIIWNQRRQNGWLFAELLVVLATVWTLLDGYWVDYRILQAPLGFDITNVWRFKLGMLGEKAPKYVPRERYTSSGPEDLTKLMDQIRRHPGVENVCVAYYSCPYSSGNSWWGMRPVDGDTLIASQQSFHVRRVSAAYFDVFRIQDVDGAPISRSAEGIQHSLIISKDLEEIFYHGKTGKGRRVILNESDVEAVIAAVCQPMRPTAYERSEPCYFQLLEGPVFHAYVEKFSPASAELCVRMKREFTRSEMNGILAEMGDLLTVNNLHVYGVQSLEEMRDAHIRSFKDNNSQKMSVLLFLLLNVFFGITGTFWLRTANRQGEMGLRVALGASRVSLRRFMYLEGFCLLLLTVLPVGVYAANMMLLDKVDSYRIPLSLGRFLITFGGTYLLMGIMVGLGIGYPVRKIMRMAPSEALHYE